MQNLITFYRNLTPPALALSDPRSDAFRETMVVQVTNAGSADPSDVGEFVEATLGLLGNGLGGIAVEVPVDPANADVPRTLLVSVAETFAETAWEVGAAGEHELEQAQLLLLALDAALQQAAIGQPELAQLPTAAEKPLLWFHKGLITTPLYQKLAALFQIDFVQQMNSGRLLLLKSVQAHMTPLRDVAKAFPPDQLPANLWAMDSQARTALEASVTTFFHEIHASRGLADGTRRGYTDEVCDALGISNPALLAQALAGTERDEIRLWDDDPAEAAGDHYSVQVCAAAEAATAAALGEEIDETGEWPGDDAVSTPSELPEWADVDPVQLARQRAWAADRTLVDRCRPLLDTRSASPHVICTLDAWLDQQPKDLVGFQNTLIVHLAVHTGRPLDEILAIHVGEMGNSAEGPVLDPVAGTITFPASIYPELPTLPADSPLKRLYLPTTTAYAVRLMPRGRELVNELLRLRGIRADGRGQPALLFTTSTGAPLTAADIKAQLFQQFNNFVAVRQPYNPKLRYGQLMAAYWRLYTNAGLAPEDAHLISGQCYPELRAPIFYLTRAHAALHAAYRATYQRVCDLLGSVFVELNPRRIPLTFDKEKTT